MVNKFDKYTNWFKAIRYYHHHYHHDYHHHHYYYSYQRAFYKLRYNQVNFVDDFMTDVASRRSSLKGISHCQLLFLIIITINHHCRNTKNAKNTRSSITITIFLIIITIINNISSTRTSTIRLSITMYANNTSTTTNYTTIIFNYEHC